MKTDGTTPPPPPPPPPPTTNIAGETPPSTHPIHKTLTSVANLANLLPTGTVLAFRTLTPSFSNKGICQISNQCLTAALVALLSITCFVSTFTDSFTDSQGRLYYGVATFKGLHIFSCGGDDDGAGNLEARLLETEEAAAAAKATRVDLSRFRVGVVDFFHAFVSLFVFLAFAFSDDDVKKCFFSFEDENLDVLLKNLPLAAGVFSGFFFTVVPTTRRGVGYADVAAKVK
ncbi:protein DMP10-like [Andrographis paniculata]|uniref:protein DMP10-like n=1 Tax=Andrographis paniculata TaxID=175694 RepID=UPI0021E98508|nr:protein DMP10-like [Andrographis paniculata]